jgi:hypothetical protein
MKKNTFPIRLFLFAAGGILLMLPGCFKDPAARIYTIYKPVYTPKSIVLASINGNAATPIDSAGKIYIKDKYIFLNELNKGIHIIDNSDPRHPKQTAFLAIPGNQDMAVKGYILYADMYGDLLAIDISDPHHVSIAGKVAGLFTMRNYVNGYPSNGEQVITGWMKKDTAAPAADGRWPITGGGCMACDFPAAFSSSAGGKGIAGSMAKMVLITNYLYTLSEQHSLGAVNITEPAAPSLESTIYAGFDLETIYPFGNKLFLGSAEGVYMYDISHPSLPVQAGRFSHGRACDPVVADGDFAYVTLHAGTSCGGASNELDVLNVKDPAQASLVNSYPMTKPMGLCMDGDLLFVCDGTEGVKVYNAGNPAKLALLTETGAGPAYDVIASDKRLLVVTDKGLYQYDYSNIPSINLLSFLPVKQ